MFITISQSPSKLFCISVGVVQKKIGVDGFIPIIIVSELFDLRLKDLDFENNIVFIWMSKWQKNRIVPLPVALKNQLEKQVEKVIKLHNNNLNNTQYKGSFLPKNSISHNSKEIGWQWLFPAKTLGDERVLQWRMLLIIHLSYYGKTEQ